VLANDRAERVGHVIERRIPAHALPRPFLAGTQLGIPRAPGRLRRQMQGGALGAQLAVVGRVYRIAPHAGDLSGVRFDQHPATGTAIAADR